MTPSWPTNSLPLLLFVGMGYPGIADEEREGLMNIYYRLAEIIAKPTIPLSIVSYPDVDPSAFGTPDGSVINIRGVNYVPQRPALRVRLHNWLIRMGERDEGWDKSRAMMR